MQTGEKNIEWLDSLRALAAIGVIVIHVSTPVVKMSYGVDSGNWWTGNIYDSAVRFAVPLFLILSGATMLSKEYTLKAFYKKRFTRVLAPFLFWMVIYWIYRWAVLPVEEQPCTVSTIFPWAIKLFLNEGISKHFWYVYMILFFYLFLPWLGKAVRKFSTRQLFWLIIGWAAFCFLTRKLPVNFYSWSGHYPERLLGYLQFSGYLVLGFYLMKIKIEFPFRRIIAGTVFLLTVAFAAISVFYFSTKAHKLDLDMHGNMTFNTMIQACSLFLLVKDTSIRLPRLLQIQQLVGNYSYGIYLAHIMIIGIGFQYGFFWTMGHPAWTVPVLTLTTLIVSTLIIFVLRKLPYGKYISG